MPSFSRNLEQSLHRALAIANERHHEYATLEHLLFSLTDDGDAAAVLRACSVDLDLLKKIFANISTRSSTIWLARIGRTPSRRRDFNASSSGRSFMFSPRGGKR